MDKNSQLLSIKLIDKSSFLKGKNNRNWVITFDWFIRPNNFIKVIEENYTDGVQHGADNFKNGEPKEVDWAERAGVVRL